MAKSPFSFNLILRKSKTDVVRQEKRSNTLLYSVLLLFGITVLWLSFRLVHLGIVNRQVTKLNQEQINLQSEINGYNLYKSQNGELVVKTNILSSVVDRHQDPDLVFNLIDNRIKQSAPNAVIMMYGRESSGNFQIKGTTGHEDDIYKLLKDFAAEESVQDISLKSSTLSDGIYTFILDLEIDVS